MRNEIEQRPLVLLCLALAAGIASAYSPWNVVFLAPLLFFGANWVKGGMIGLFLVGYITAPGEQVRELPKPGPVKFVTTISSYGRKAQLGSSFHCRAGESEFTLLFKDSPRLVLGEEIEVSGSLQLPREGSKPDLMGVVEVESFQVVRDAPFWTRIAANWRASFTGFTHEVMDPSDADLIDAMCLNTGLPPDSVLQDNLKRTGTLHIISAAGLHVVIFGFVLQFVLQFAPIQRWLQILVLLGFLGIYAAAAGFATPILRSVLMSGFLFGAYLWRREADALSSLAGAAIVFLLASPGSATEPGFLISFVTVAAFALFGSFYRRKNSDEPLIWHRAKAAGYSSLVAWTASAPILAYAFGNVSLVSVPANLIVVPVIPPMILTGLFSWVISPVASPISIGLMKLICEPLAGFINLVVNAFGSTSLASMDVPPFSGYWLLVVYGSALLLRRPRARPV